MGDNAPCEARSIPFPYRCVTLCLQVGLVLVHDQTLGIATIIPDSHNKYRYTTITLYTVISSINPIGVQCIG